MTDEQRADFEAGLRAKKFNADNSTALGSISDDTLPGIIAGIIAQVGATELAEGKQQHDAGDVSGDKEELKKEMGKVVIKFAMRGQVKAEVLGLDELASSLEHPVGYISGVDDVLAVTRANDLKGIMNVNKGPDGVLANIVEGDISTMTDAIKAFTDVQTDPTDIVKEKKAEGTDKIQPAVDLLNDFMEKERKLLHSYWDGTANSGLVDEFDLKSHPILLGRRHNIVSVTMVKDEEGGALQGGLLTCLANDKTSDGDKTNVYTIEGIRNGVRGFRAEAAGRVSQDFDVTVKRGRTVEVTVRMKLV